MIARLVAQQEREKGPRRLTDGTGKGEAEAADGEPRAKKPRRAMARDSLPSSLHAMSVGQLKGVCAAHGWQPRSSTQAGIIKVKGFCGVCVRSLCVLAWGWVVCRH